MVASADLCTRGKRWAKWFIQVSGELVSPFQLARTFSAQESKSFFHGHVCCYNRWYNPLNAKAFPALRRWQSLAGNSFNEICS